MVNPDQRQAQELAEVGKKVLALYKELDPTADFSVCESHRRNTQNELAGRHFQAAIRNAERVIDSVVAIFVRRVDSAIEKHPELGVGLTKLRLRASGLVYKLTSPGTGFECVGQLRLLLQDLDLVLASVSTPTKRSEKNVPQRGKERKGKGSRGPGSHKRYRA